MIDKVNGILKNDSEIADMFENTLLHTTDYISNWAMNRLQKSNQYLTSITSGLISIFKVLLNIVVGLIVLVYLLFSKETFIGQFKKLTYALFKPKRANIIIETARKEQRESFGGFISGKILDSTIIGIICYIVLLIMKMPYAVLVSVIVGVTNVIPFFGPFIGAVPGFIIIVFANPLQDFIS